MLMLIMTRDQNLGLLGLWRGRKGESLGSHAGYSIGDVLREKILR